MTRPPRVSRPAWIFGQVMTIIIALTLAVLAILIAWLIIAGGIRLLMRFS